MTTDVERALAARRILNHAVAVAQAAPKRKGFYTFAAQIPWTTINDLRDALDAAHIKWRSDDD
jgi:hypothetical protein